MLYHVSRNGQMYGPYTIEDLQRYVLSGNVLPTDLAKTDAMPGWLPVHQILSAAGIPTTAIPTTAVPTAGASTAYSTTSIYPQTNPNTYPDPPNLPWALVMLFSILTCGIFMVVWNIIVAAWVKRVRPTSLAIVYYIAGAVLLFVNSGTSFGFVFAMHHHHVYHRHPVAGLIALVGWVVRLIARFTMRTDLEAHFNGPEPLGLRLSSAMTFFFGGLYFQYHINRINEIKAAIRYQRLAFAPAGNVP